ncbi:hypothetical protein CK203_108160 [Vitis vinifera]|uniref:Uncharacterized protein n=1 Tax=Vitis vinifera TaxID=29760 RepID=A0A438DJJ9_VITVI|nr:hypothetical protein CK203_108160 [Vitis vinifera]
MSNSDWVEAALMNQSVVAELLIRLKYSDPAPMRSSHGVAVDWSVRQRRSKQILKEKGEPARDSPSTPLSWRSATSASGGATDVEDSTRADKASDMRSKCLPSEKTKAPRVKGHFRQFILTSHSYEDSGVRLKPVLTPVVLDDDIVEMTEKSS